MHAASRGSARDKGELFMKNLPVGTGRNRLQLDPTLMVLKLLNITMKLNGMYECASRTPAGWDAAVLRQEIVGVSSTATVGKQKTSFRRLVEIYPWNISWADALVLNLRTLI